MPPPSRGRTAGAHAAGEHCEMRAGTGIGLSACRCPRPSAPPPAAAAAAVPCVPRVPACLRADGRPRGAHPGRRGGHPGGQAAMSRQREGTQGGGGSCGACAVPGCHARAVRPFPAAPPFPNLPQKCVPIPLPASRSATATSPAPPRWRERATPASSSPQASHAAPARLLHRLPAAAAQFPPCCLGPCCACATPPPAQPP